MNHDDRELVNARIGQLLHTILVQIRAWTWTAMPDDLDRRAEINDLVDIAHNLPNYIAGLDEHGLRTLDDLRSDLVKHLLRFHPDADPSHHRYLIPLDMDSETFLRRYRDHDWAWTPVAAGQPQTA